MALEGSDQFVLLDLPPAEPDIDVPRLVVDARAHELEFALVPRSECCRDLLAAMLDTVTKPDGVDLAVFDRGPRVHRHGVGVVQEPGIACGNLANVPAEIEDHRDVALPVQDAAGADRVADALVDAVLQWDANVVGIGLEAADAHATDDVAGALERFAPLGRGGDFRRQPVGGNDTVEDPPHHDEVVLADIGKRELDVAKFGHRHDVGDESFGKSDAARADDRDLHLLMRSSNSPCRSAAHPSIRLRENGAPFECSDPRPLALDLLPQCTCLLARIADG